MKKFFKVWKALLFLFITAFLWQSGKGQAAEVGAEIDVMFVMFQNDGMRETIPIEEKENIMNTIILPSGETVTMERFIKDGNTVFRYIIAKGNETLEDLMGNYILKDIQYPKGYEYDTQAMEEEYLKEEYPLSVTIQEEDVKEYQNYLDFWKESEITDEYSEMYSFTIQIPVKKVGEDSQIIQPPPKVELYISETGLSIANEQQSYYTEYYYAKKQNGEFKLLTNSNMCFFTDYSELKDNSTYYFKVRFAKLIKGENVYGEYSDIVKVKVRKSLVSKYTPKLRKTKKNGDTILSVSGDEDYYDIMLYYSSKKHGKYKFSIQGSFLKEIPLSKIPGLKKGKTYYFKARYCDSKKNNEVFYGKFGKIIAVKI